MSKIKIRKRHWENGNIHWECQYQNNQKHGTEKWWYSNGQLKHNILYKNNQLHGVTNGWHKNGQLIYESSCENGQYIEVTKWWHKNGQIMDKIYYLYNKETTEEEYRKHILIESLACLK